MSMSALNSRADLKGNLDESNIVNVGVFVGWNSSDQIRAALHRPPHQVFAAWISQNAFLRESAGGYDDSACSLGTALPLHMISIASASVLWSKRIVSYFFRQRLAPLLAARRDARELWLRVELLSSLWLFLAYSLPPSLF
jgi:hypothetical protein